MMNPLRAIVRRSRRLRAAAHLLPRAARALSSVARPARYILPWVLASRETTNYTYDLTPISRRYLAALIADITDSSAATIMGYFAELEQDEELRGHIRALTLAGREAGVADTTARYGRRLGWYALARSQKPGVIVETGVDKGLGGCVLAAALLRNAREGRPGRYYGTEINPRAGYLLAGRYREAGEILYGDSLASLRAFRGRIDLFINDSDHSPAYEAQEYVAIEQKLGPGALILGDNAHVSDALFQFAQRTGRRFVYFQEAPAEHWYPGGGIGVAFQRATPPS